MPAWAEAPTPDDLARRHFESGAAYFQEGDYENALRAYQKAYELSKRPLILVNIANVHERTGQLPLAVEALRAYIAAAPDAADVETVRLRIANIEKRIAAEPAPSASAAPSAAPVPTSSSAPVAAPPPVAPPAAEAPSRAPALIVLSIGGLALVGAGVTGYLASSDYDDKKSSCAPRCSGSDVDGVKSMALTSTVLTGVGIVGLGVGAALWFGSSPSAEQPPRASAWHRPRVDVGAGPVGASATATWRFW